MFSADDLIKEAVDKYSNTVYRIAFNITQNTHDAYDVVQEVLLRLIKNRGKIKNNGHLKAWLIRTTVNCAKTSVKKSNRHSFIGIDEIKESLIDENQFIEPITEYVLKLPEKYKTALYLFYYEDMPVAEIADALGVTQSAVKLRLKRGREKLKDILEGEGYND